jgi:hypothetical protein
MLSSRDRILRSISGQPTDHVPLCMFLFSLVRERCSSDFEFYQKQMDMGLDVVVELGELPLARHPQVRVEVRVEKGSPNPLLRQIYHTPAGDLETVVEKTSDWPHGDQVPLMSDFVIPRSKKFLVTEEKDLAPLAYVLAAPSDEDVAAFARRADLQRSFAQKNQLATRAGFNRLSDMICWLCGCEQFATMGLTEPGFFQKLVDLIAAWQEKRIEAVLRARPDILCDAQWYATTFLSPALYERFLAAAMKRRVDLAHAAGAKFCTVATANVLPFADVLSGTGIDALFGVDPVQGNWDLAAAKRDLGGRMCLWGGVNGYLTILESSADEVRKAVADSMAALAPGGRFILAAVDNVRTEPDSPPGTWDRAWANMQIMVEEWKARR